MPPLAFVLELSATLGIGMQPTPLTRLRLRLRHIARTTTWTRAPPHGYDINLHHTPTVLSHRSRELTSQAMLLFHPWLPTNAAPLALNFAAPHCCRTQGSAAQLMRGIAPFAVAVQPLEAPLLLRAWPCADDLQSIASASSTFTQQHIATMPRVPHSHQRRTSYLPSESCTQTNELGASKHFAPMRLYRWRDQARLPMR